MDYRAFYDQLFAPIEVRCGAFDRDTIAPVIGFDAGGPLSFRTIGRGKRRFVTYVSCELAVRDDQLPSSLGRFEIMVHADNEEWVRRVLSSVGSMSLDIPLDHGHTIDLASFIEKSAVIQAVVLESFASVLVDGTSYGILACHGLTRSELEFTRKAGVEALMDRLKAAGVYPNTSLLRQPVSLDA